MNTDLEKIAEYERLAEKRPNTYLPKLAELQLRLAEDYRAAGHPDKEEKALLAALHALDRYTGRREEAVFGKITVLQRLIDRYNRAGRLEDSERMFLRLLEIREALADKEGFYYQGEDLSVAQWRLANLYVDMKRFNDAERLYRAALKTREEFDEEDPDRYRPGTAQFERSLGQLYERHFSDNVRAAACYFRSVAILEKLAENRYERCNYLRPLILSYRLLADLCEKNAARLEAE